MWIDLRGAQKNKYQNKETVSFFLLKIFAEMLAENIYLKKLGFFNLQKNCSKICLRPCVLQHNQMLPVAELPKF